MILAHRPKLPTCWDELTEEEKHAWALAVVEEMQNRAKTCEAPEAEARERDRETLSWRATSGSSAWLDRRRAEG